MRKLLNNDRVKLVLVVLVIALITSLVVNMAPGLPIPKNVFRIGFEGVTYAVTPDYTCDHNNDDAQVSSALNSLPSSGGKIILYGGTYDFDATVSRAIDNVTFEGAGVATYLGRNNSDFLITCAGQTGWMFKDIGTDAGGFGGTFGTDNFRLMCWINTVLTNDLIENTAYGAGWNSDNIHTPTQDAVYDEMEDRFLDSGDTLTGQIVLSGSGLVYLRFRPVLDQNAIGKNLKPDVVYRGLVRGFSMPIYASDAEELFFTEPYVPRRWDGASDIIVRVSGYLDTANNTKRFRLQVAWEHNTPGTDVIVNTENTDNQEVLTGNWAQYQSFSQEFTIDYNIDGADVVAAGDILSLRLRRIAKTGAEAEITGEVVITGLTMKYRCDKFASSS